MQEFLDWGREIAAEIAETTEYEARFTREFFDDELQGSILLPSEALNNDQEFRLNLKYSPKTGRVTITSNKPRALDGTEHPTEESLRNYSASISWPNPITVGWNRTIRGIVKDISGKLLNGYIYDFMEAVEERDFYDEHCTSVSPRVGEIVELIGGDVSVDSIKNAGPGAEFGIVQDLHVGHETINIHITNIPFDLAKEMLTVWMHGGRREQIREFGKVTELGFIHAKRIVESATEATSASRKSFEEMDDKDMREFWLSTARTASIKLGELAAKRSFTVDFIESTRTYQLVKGDDRFNIPTFEE